MKNTIRLLLVITGVFVTLFSASLFTGAPDAVLLASDNTTSPATTAPSETTTPPETTPPPVTSEPPSSDNTTPPPTTPPPDTANTTAPAETQTPEASTPVNNPPAFSMNYDWQTIEGLLLKFTVDAYDPDGDILTYSASNLPQGANFDEETRVFSWTPEAADVYPDIRFSVTDGKSDPVETTVTITVLESSLFEGRIMYRSGDDSFIINADGSGKTTLEAYGKGPAWSVCCPYWSPDGTKKVFSESGNIYVSNADGSNKVNLGTGDFPAYSPDGSKIVFIKSDNIYVMNADGSDILQLTDEGVNKSPLWNAQGTKILFISIRQENPELWLMDNDSGNPVKIVDNAGIPAWSPDGTKIAFFNSSVCICSPDGTVIASAPITGSFGFRLLWTPDSKSVGFLYTSQRGLRLLNTDGSQSSAAGARLVYYTFSPDCQWVCHTLDHTQGLFLTSFDRKIRIQLTDEPVSGDPLWFIEAAQPVNTPPTLEPIGDKTVTAGETLQITISAADPDGDMLTYSASNIPPGATFDANTRTFTWKPAGDCSWTGLRFQVSDGKLTDSEDINITVSPSPAPQYTLTVNTTGKGKVELNPACNSYIGGTLVQLTAVPDNDWVFSGWSGGLSGSAATASITLNADATVTASFTQPTATTSVPAQNPPPPPPYTSQDVTVNDLTVIINLNVSIAPDGRTLKDFEAYSVDRNVWVVIPENTICRTSAGTSLATVSIEKLAALPDGVPSDGLTGPAYLFSPDGATFDPPVTVNFGYDPSLLPDGYNEEDIKIVWWDNTAKAWVQLETGIDPEDNIASAPTSHCSIFTLMAKAAPVTATAATQAAVTSVPTTQPAVTPAPTEQQTQAAVLPAANPVYTPTPEASAAEDDDTPSSNIGMILLTIGGGLFVVALAVILIIYNARKEKEEPVDIEKPDDKDNPGDENNPPEERQ